MKKILVISNNLPFPPKDGGRARIYHLYSRLAKKYQITWVSPIWDGEEENIPGTLRFCHQVIPLPKEEIFSFPSSGWKGLMKRVLAHLHFPRLFEFAFGYVNAPGVYWLPKTPQRLRKIQEILEQNHFDLIISEFEGNAELIPEQITIPRILSTHNVQSHLFWRARKTFPGTWLDRVFLFPEWQKIIHYEKKNYRRYNGILAVSQNDQRTLEKRCPGIPVKLVPNGVDTEYFFPSSSSPVPHTMVYLGNYAYPPNADAVRYFYTRIFPKIRARFPDAKLILIGASPPKELCGEDGVEALGFVEDVRPNVHQAEVMIVPLRTGGGTRLKILDGMAMGKAIVSTTLGAEGLQVIDGENILLADTPDTFAAQVIRIMENAELRQKLEKNGRTLVERLYNWDAIAREAGEWIETFLYQPALLQLQREEMNAQG
ncbi:putative glycosyltransferase [Anaerolinea thermophila UNI-1]|uniref:Glycosyltransferase n=2 Tax=Anaerolinea thermophila TaxID=167964 RepID=E8MXG7_ANATU|nr:glycosyltransferase [Anaerolinea thermophila]BAJ64048.1 putative glycosyltransferase [Anaerolinea thermophila UNI-1]